MKNICDFRIQPTGIRNHKEQSLLTAWQNANSNLNFNKTLQWNLVYYSLLLFGSIIALITYFEPKEPFIFVSFIIVNLIFDIGLYLTWKNQHQIRRERLSMRNQTMQIAVTQCDLNKIRNEIIDDQKVLTHPLITSAIVGAIFAGYVTSSIVIISTFS